MLEGLNTSHNLMRPTSVEMNVGRLREHEEIESNRSTITHTQKKEHKRFG